MSPGYLLRLQLNGSGPSSSTDGLSAVWVCGMCMEDSGDWNSGSSSCTDGDLKERGMA